MQDARVTYLTSPKRKATTAARASALGVSMGEYVRRRVESDDDDLTVEQEAELATLVAQVNAAVPKMQASLDAISRKLRETHVEVDRMLRAMGARS